MDNKRKNKKNKKFQNDNFKDNINKEDDVNEEETFQNVDLEKTKIQLQNINIIREELIKLDLNIRQKLYYETEIIPLLTTLELLTRSSENLSLSVENLFNINLSKSSKLKSTVELIYDINESCEEMYKALQCKLKILINISKKCK